MKKILYCILSIVAVLSTNHSSAQFAYSLTTYSQLYSPLTGQPSFNNNHIWRGDTSYFVISPGFSFKLDTINTNFFYWGGANTFTCDPGNSVFSGFNVSEANFIDRGAVGGISKSPARFVVTGVPGNRILKVEAYNVGFSAEYDSLHTTNDSACVQIWLFEGSNTVEIHYGPSRITHPNLYFSQGMGPQVFYVQDNTLYPSQNGLVFILAGLANNPGYWGYTITNGTLNSVIVPLHSWPPDGTVYRFTLNNVSVPEVQTTDNIKVYPTPAYNELVLSGTTTPVQYTVFSINGTPTSVAGRLHDTDTHIDISQLAAGIYLLVIEENGTKVVRKFVKM